MSYFERLQHDWDELGLFLHSENPKDNPIAPVEVETYDNLSHVLFCAAENIHDDRTRRYLVGVNERALYLETTFAKHILKICQLDEYARMPNYICAEAEPKLVSAMQPSRLIDKTKASPVIVTRGSEAVGIIKQVGDTNYYALSDDPETETFAGHFYQTTLDGLSHPFSRDLVAPHAWNMPLNEAFDHMESGNRFSIFMIPQKARKNLISTNKNKKYADAEQEALRTSHEYLVELANAALARSEEITISQPLYDDTLPTARPTAVDRRIMESVVW